jgi:hypothetical protein
MPSIATASEPVTSFPNLYISPYGNDGVIQLYSSIPFSVNTPPGCLPCVMCGNSNLRENLLGSESYKLQPTLSSGTRLTLTN